MSTDQVPFRKEARLDFGAPVRLRAHLDTRSRETYVLDHGFTATQIGTGWWRDQGIELAFPSIDDDGTQRLTRADLFTMANDVKDDEDLLVFLWHVVAWGSGNSRRQNLQRIRNARARPEVLRRAFDAAREDGARHGYSTLVRSGGGVIPHLGPAFFSKFLYFAAPTNCLILDARVARSLYADGWNISPRAKSPDGPFSYNWYTDTYVSYCDLLQRWAGELHTEPDMIERALFDLGR